MSRQLNSKKTKKSFLTNLQLTTGLKAISDQAEKLKLGKCRPKFIQGTINYSLNKNATLKIKDSSIDRYDRIWRNFLYYCIATEDYESGILFHPENNIERPCAPSLRSVINCARFHVWEKGTVLTCYETQQPVKFFDENNVECIGDWTALSTIRLFSSALSTRSKSFKETRGVYESKCSLCLLALKQNGIISGCNEGHFGHPCFLNRGNITNSSDFKIQMGILEKYIIESNQSRSTVALFPSQLRQIKSHLLNSNNLDDLMLWTLLIVCIKQFLRICEGISLTTESFVTDLATKLNYKVNSLTTRIRGKTDVNEVYLQLWDDEECPEFSPVIALLIYIALSDIQDGFIFPNTQNASLHVKYQTVLYKIKKLTSELLKLNVNRDDENGFIVGTHLARKTGLLLARWSFLSYS